MRKQVVEVQCERCARVEHREADPKTANLTKFQGSFYTTAEGDQSVDFDDLCEPCAATVKQHFDAIRKPIKGLSPKREKGPKTVEELIVVPEQVEAKKKGSSPFSS